LIDEGKVRPLVEKCYPLEEAATAQEQLERKHARGKTVIQVERGRSIRLRGSLTRCAVDSADGARSI
jgi:hypothetical protein